MLIYHEQSETVTISANMTIAKIEAHLRTLCRTLGYVPTSHENASIKHCLARRIPNRLFLRYGDIADLCIGWEMTLANGHTWTIRPYPRAATGPDFRQFLIGNTDSLGAFLKTCTLKAFHLPEEDRYLCFSFSEPPPVDTFVPFMGDQNIRPLGMWSGSAKQLDLKKKNIIDPTHTLVWIALAGDKRRLDVEAMILSRYFELRKGTAITPLSASDRALFARILDGHHPESTSLIGAPHHTFAPMDAAHSETWLKREWEKINLYGKGSTC